MKNPLHSMKHLSRQRRRQGWTLAWHFEESEDTRIRRSEGPKIQESEDLNLCLGGITSFSVIVDILSVFLHINKSNQFES